MFRQLLNGTKWTSLWVLSLVFLIGTISACQPLFPQSSAVPLSTVPCGATGDRVLFRGQARADGQGQALLYVGDHDRLYAIDGQRGRVLWCRRLVSTDSEEESISPDFAALRRSGHSLYSGTDEGRLVALDADSGQVRWVAENYDFFGNEDWEAPTVDEQRQLIYGVDSSIGFYAVGSTDGKMRWQQNLSQGLPAKSQVLPRLLPKVSGNVAVAAVSVYTRAGSNSENLLLLGVEAQTGKRLWEHLWPLGKNLRLQEPLKAEQGVIGLLIDGKGLLGIRVTDGKLLWEIQLQGTSYSRLVGAAEGVFYLQIEAGKNPQLWAVKAASGRVLWKVIAEEGGGLWTAVDRQTLYLTGEDGGLEALEVGSGHKLWRQQIAANAGHDWMPMSQPVVEGNTVYVLTSGLEANGPYVLHAVDRVSGKVEWEMTFGERGYWIVPVLGA
ncbi:PQQ-binding-like beta-propeller repeat protein [Thermogemmatispora sp.]|uniref:PQQ-binding-like beta-propeller repeat protein n=1 Tax=Thermogemmatispora sp. TaxID=1968838 RepID=UPI001DF176C9|nr:PQQ-binding-like beta-propeller repeat protein [Thermogemmatispora sp.]MBX5449377.1 PQQ-binding-like beta-propeller repeat protein [Thermogemmatispora sp.]